MDDLLQAVYQNGINCCNSGFFLKENPFIEGTDYYKEWRRGWNKARHDKYSKLKKEADDISMERVDRARCGL